MGTKLFRVFLIIVWATTLMGLTFGARDAAAKKKFISIATGGTGGVYYPYGGGLAEIWTRYVPDVQAVAEVTGASVENTRLVNRGESLIGEIMNDVAYQAYYAEERFKGKPQKILAMFQMHPQTHVCL